MAFFLIYSIFALLPLFSSGSTNDRPIIGVLSQNVKNEQDSYIAASYVKFLEAAGARVAPILLDQSDDYYRKLFSNINGVLFPGGSSSIYTSAYAKTGRIFYDLAIEANDNGNYFPVLGVCLGYQMLTYFRTDRRKLLARTNTTAVSLPLDFTEAANDSRVFRDFPADLMDDLANKPLTENSHKYSMKTSTHGKYRSLREFYNILSTNTVQGIKFVSTVEAYHYPIYGTIWHPEKNAFEWNRAHTVHTPAALRTTFYMAQFIVSEARKNSQRFQSEEEESNALIYNYKPTYSGPKGYFVQKYYF